MSKYNVGIILVTLGALLFSTGGVFLVYAENASAITGLFYRLSIGVVVILAYLRFVEKESWYDICIPHGKSAYALMILGLSMQYLFILSLKFMPTVNAFGLYAILPILGVLINSVIFKQKVAFITYASAIFCLVGIVYAFYDQFSFKGELMLGIVLNLISILAGAVIFVILKNNPSIKSVSTFGQSWFLGTVALLPFIDYHLSYNEMWWLSAGGITSAIASAVLAVGPKYIMPSETTILLQIETIFGIFFGWLFLDDVISLQMLIGLILAITSVVVNSSYGLYQHKLYEKRLYRESHHM